MHTTWCACQGTSRQDRLEQWRTLTVSSTAWPPCMSTHGQVTPAEFSFFWEWFFLDKKPDQCNWSEDLFLLVW